MTKCPPWKANLERSSGASLDDLATRKRETRALLEAARQHPKASLHLISLDIPAAVDIPRDITGHEAWAWLLQGNERDVIAVISSRRIETLWRITVHCCEDRA